MTDDDDDETDEERQERLRRCRRNAALGLTEGAYLDDDEHEEEEARRETNVANENTPRLNIYTRTRALDIYTDLPRVYRGRVILGDHGDLVLLPDGVDNLDELHCIVGMRPEGARLWQWMGWMALCMHGTMTDTFGVEPDSPFPPVVPPRMTAEVFWA
jgi:hypothetical protein